MSAKPTDPNASLRTASSLLLSHTKNCRPFGSPLFSRRFPPEVICPERLWDGLVSLPLAQAGSYSVYCGHFFGHLDRYLGKRTTKVTLLRNPVERTISHFAQVRRDEAHPFHERCRSQTLMEFVTMPETRHMVANFQARYLATWEENVATLAPRFSSCDLKRFRLQTYLETVSLPADAVLYNRARLALGGFAFVGTTERFDEAMHHVAEMLGLPSHTPFEPQNASAESDRSELDAATKDAMLGATVVDRALYDYAISLQ